LFSHSKAFQRAVYFLPSNRKAFEESLYEMILIFIKKVEHALVDDRIPYGIPKKPSCCEAGSHTFYKVG
jgi:hypothetical protein